MACGGLPGRLVSLKIASMWSVASLFLVLSVAAAQPPSQRELNGYVLGQHIETLEPLGEPEEEMETDDGWLYRTYVLQEDPLLLMVFKFPADDPDFMISVQVSGEASAMMPFLGLRLGASSADVRKVFGQPTSVEQLTDPPVEVWKYKDRNYSFEFDKQKGLTSIQLFAFDGFAPAKPPTWSAVRIKLLSTDIDTLMSAFSADAEIYKDDDLYGIDDSMRKVFSNPSSEFRQGLTLLVAALRSPEMGEPVDSNLRVSDDGPPQHVIKFGPDSPVREIVFLDQAGESLIWEVHLRDSPIV